MRRQKGWQQVLSTARRGAKMHTDIVPLAHLKQWGLRLTDGSVISFYDLANRFDNPLGVDAVVRVLGGFYEHRGAVVSPNGREAEGGWEQTANVVVPEDQIGIVGLVVDKRPRSQARFLVEFREEALAVALPGQIVASASAVCSFSNRTGAHGYKGARQYLDIVDNLVESVRVDSRGDMGRFLKRNQVVIFVWQPKPDKILPDLTGKHYVWCTRRQIETIIKQGIASIHLLEALAVYEENCF